MKSLTPKKPPKDEREKQVLMGLVDLYLSEGRPIGSQTLQESGFDGLSSATIRNYFSKLEQSGYLKQQHSSGGRIPTERAFRLYAEEVLRDGHLLDMKEKKEIADALKATNNEVASYLHKVAEFTASKTQCAVFLSSPRFDQDFILDVRLIALGASRYLAVMLTDFGNIETEVLYLDKKISLFSLKRIEQFFRFKMTGLDQPALQEGEQEIAEELYQEVMLRYIVKNSSEEMIDLYKTGFSKLLSYPDFNDSSALAQGLMLFENNSYLISLLSKSLRSSRLEAWVGEQLTTICPSASLCSSLVIPYKIHQSIAGAFGLLGPMRIPYRKLFALLEFIAEVVSENLTQIVYKHKLTFRQPKKMSPFEIGLWKNEHAMKEPAISELLLEDLSSDTIP